MIVFLIRRDGRVQTQNLDLDEPQPERAGASPYLRLADLEAPAEPAGLGMEVDPADIPILTFRFVDRWGGHPVFRELFEDEVAS